MSGYEPEYSPDEVIVIFHGYRHPREELARTWEREHGVELIGEYPHGHTLFVYQAQGDPYGVFEALESEWLFVERAWCRDLGLGKTWAVIDGLVNSLLELRDEASTMSAADHSKQLRDILMPNQ